MKNLNSNPNSDGDRNLVSFLKAHQPIAPSASPNLQALIMEQVASLEVTRAIAKPVKKVAIRTLGLLGAAVVTVISLVIFNQNRPIQVAVNETESLKIEKSLVSNWYIPEEEFTTSYSLISTSK